LLGTTWGRRFRLPIWWDTGSPLWQTQGLFLVYWLIFEGFDLLRADPWLLPLNALGFLALSTGKWTHAAPNDIWQLAAGAAALYLAGAIVRARAGRWKAAALCNAALATTAVVLKLHDQWLPLGLLIEAELYYLAGVRFRSTFLRTLAGAIFGLETANLLFELVPRLSAPAKNSTAGCSMSPPSRPPSFSWPASPRSCRFGPSVPPGR
jgi:hypothetical protein